MSTGSACPSCLHRRAGQGSVDRPTAPGVAEEAGTQPLAPAVSLRQLTASYRPCGRQQTVLVVYDRPAAQSDILFPAAATPVDHRLSGAALLRLRLSPNVARPAIADRGRLFWTGRLFGSRGCEPQG